MMKFKITSELNACSPMYISVAIENKDTYIAPYWNTGGYLNYIENLAIIETEQCVLENWLIPERIASFL